MEEALSFCFSYEETPKVSKPNAVLKERTLEDGKRKDTLYFLKSWFTFHPTKLIEKKIIQSIVKDEAVKSTTYRELIHIKN